MQIRRIIRLSLACIHIIHIMHINACVFLQEMGLVNQGEGESKMQTKLHARGSQNDVEELAQGALGD